MPKFNTEALIQGLFNCGSYEKGQTFIKDHAGEITQEFISALRETSMDLLTGHFLGIPFRIFLQVPTTASLQLQTQHKPLTNGFRMLMG